MKYKLHVRWKEDANLNPLEAHGCSLQGLSSRLLGKKEIKEFFEIRISLLIGYLKLLFLRLFLGVNNLSFTIIVSLLYYPIGVFFCNFFGVK